MTRSLAIWLTLALAAGADEVTLTDGTVVEGKVEDLGDSIRITRSGGSVTYPKTMVRKIEIKETREELYAKKTKELKKDDVEGRLKLAKWCDDHKLFKEARLEYQKILEADPDQEAARAALGYQKYKDKWMTEDEAKEAQGFVKHEGKWMTPEERDLDLALDTQKELDREILLEVRKWLDKMSSSKEDVRAEARGRLEKIDDRHKVKPFLAAITSSYKNVRAFVVEELGRMMEKTAAKPLVRRAIWDSEEPIRASALKALIAINHPDTAAYLIPYLEEESVLARMRVEEALAFFKDLRAVPPLLQILENDIETLQFIEKYAEQMKDTLKRTLILKNGQKVVVPSRIIINAEFWDPKHKRAIQDEKQTVLTTLRAITGADFGEDVARWKAWFEKNKK